MGSGDLDPFFRTLVKSVLGNCGRRERHLSVLVPSTDLIDLKKTWKVTIPSKVVVVVVIIRKETDKAPKVKKKKISCRLRRRIFRF